MYICENGQQANDIFVNIIDDFFPLVSRKEMRFDEKKLDNSPVFPEDKKILEVE